MPALAKGKMGSGYVSATGRSDALLRHRGRNLTPFAVGLALSLSMLAGAGCKSDSGNGVEAPGPDDGGPGNAAPTISGVPDDSVTVGDEFAFAPQTQDPDGDVLSFTISNRPGWAAFDDADGGLSGTPMQGDEGVYDDIRITVSDGEDSASLNFDLTVNAEGADVGSITLSWVAPTENEDGSTLSNLAGYKIYYGRASGSYTNEIRIDNPSVDTYMIENLSATTWYIAATSFNSDGVESRYTNELVVVAN